MYRKAQVEDMGKRQSNAPILRNLNSSISVLQHSQSFILFCLDQPFAFRQNWLGLRFPRSKRNLSGLVQYCQREIHFCRLTSQPTDPFNDLQG